MSAEAADLRPPRGLIVDLLTPFDARGRVEWDSLARLLDHVGPWADCLLLFGPEVGGGPDMGPRARARMAQFVAERCDLPLLTFITQTTKELALTSAKVLAAIDAAHRVFLVDAPLLVRSNRGLPDWLNRVHDATGRPVLLYNHPRLMDRIASQTKRRNIRTSVLKKAAEETEGLAGLLVKGPAKRLVHYRQAVRSRPGFRLYDAVETRFLDNPSSAGVVSAGANLLPAAWARVVRSALHLDDSARAAELLACAKAARRLARRLQARPLGWLTAGLKIRGVLSARLPDPKDGPDPTKVESFLAGLGPAKWCL